MIYRFATLFSCTWKTDPSNVFCPPNLLFRFSAERYREDLQRTEDTFSISGDSSWGSRQPCGWTRTTRHSSQRKNSRDSRKENKNDGIEGKFAGHSVKFAIFAQRGTKDGHSTSGCLLAEVPSVGKRSEQCVKSGRTGERCQKPLALQTGKLSMYYTHCFYSACWLVVSMNPILLDGLHWNFHVLYIYMTLA